jgi:hypothetical protein
MSPTGVFDRELELQRLAALCRGGEFGAVAARVEQSRYAREESSDDHLKVPKKHDF